MSKVIRIPSELYERLEKHAKGFDTPTNVIESLLNYFESTATEDLPNIPADTSPNKKDKTKYSFCNKEYGKGRLVLAVVKKYVSDHQGIDIKKLLIAFPKDLQKSSLGVFNEFMYVEEKYAEKTHKRHFMKPDEIIRLNGSDVVVCTEWGVGNIEVFIQQAESLGYSVTPING